MATTIIQRETPTQRDGRPLSMDIEDIDDALERLSVRVNAVHAHRASLNRAAQGLGAVQRTLEFVLGDAIARHGWTSEAHRAHAALGVMSEHIDHVLRSDGEMQLETKRECLRHALFQAGDARTLLDGEPG